MRLLTSWLICATAVASGQTYFLDDKEAGWEKILRSMGMVAGEEKTAAVLVNQAGEGIQRQVEDGTVLLLTGHSEASLRWGVEPQSAWVETRQIRDVSSPELPIVWEQPERLPATRLSSEWQIRAWERWGSNPVLAWRRLGRGAIVWAATEPGKSGYERYPFLPQALLAAGVETKVKAGGLWAFFDAGYRQRVDQKFLVAQWKAAGIGAIHVTSWQFDEAEEPQARWLRNLIELCHAQKIHVYAWIELPHVSEKFWLRYPECREKTATGMDASLDWRKLMNLVEPRCAQLAEQSVMRLLRDFDWDGANLGELYFESLEGHASPARFTPFHEAVQAEYRKLHGREMLHDLAGEGLPALLAFRADLAAGLQADWLSKLETLRQKRPDFDIIVTHIDDRFDTRMRDALGADAARILRGTEGQGTGFLIEDPATVWHLGPSRYREIRKRYEGLTAEPERLSIDINIVERYQDVYPTRQQTGAELAQLIHEAAASFDQVALYFEYSLRPIDLPLLGAATARLEAWQQSEEGLRVKLGAPAKVRWQGPAKVNGWTWPITDGEWLHLPAGQWTIERAEAEAPLRVVDTNARLEGVVCKDEICEVKFTSRAGAWISYSNAETVRLGRGSGSVKLSVKPLASGLPHSSAQLLLPH